MDNAHAFSDAERAAVYRAIRERRDVRRFVPGPLPEVPLSDVVYHDRWGRRSPEGDPA